jgi:RNA-directed DNA polymerase
MNYNKKNKFNSSFISWNTINWSKVYFFVNNIKFLIAKSKEESFFNLRRWQTILIRSKANILCSIAEITVTNDSTLFFLHKLSLKHNNLLRWQLFLYFLDLNFKDLIILLKYNKFFRFNNFGTIKSLILQNIIKNALQPEWDISFNSVSYYYNTRKNFIDVISNFYFALLFQKKNKWVLFFNLSFDFSKINSVSLLKDLQQFPPYFLAFYFIKLPFFSFFNLNCWKFFEIEVKFFLESVTIFPLVVNILLIELNKIFYNFSFSFWNFFSNPLIFYFFRFINDLVFILPSLLICNRIKLILNFWLNLNCRFFYFSSTIISNINTGVLAFNYNFSFLGFQSFYLFIFPYFEVVNVLKIRLREVWFKFSNYSLHSLILKVNPIIRNWVQYFKPFLSFNIFFLLDSFLWKRGWRYLKNRHLSKSSRWVYFRYYHSNVILKKKSLVASLIDCPQVFLLNFKDFSLSADLFFSDFLFSYKFFLSFGLFYKKYYISSGSSFFRFSLNLFCLFFCSLCYSVILLEDIVILFFFRFIFKKSKKIKNFIFILHKSCVINFYSLQIPFNFIKFRFLFYYS